MTERDTRAAAIARAAEVYGVIAEELSEYFVEACKKEHLRGRLAMRRELIDIACAAIRAAAELEDHRG